MTKMSYKTFVWPQNPHTYQEKTAREPHFRTQEGITYFDGMGGMQRIITGSGNFHGADAYDQFKLLQKLFEDDEPGDLSHPVWGLRYCYFTGLELTQEPKENVVSYRFEFTQADANGVIPK